MQCGTARTRQIDLTIILPVFNGADFLRAEVGHLLQAPELQDCCYEVLLCNDGSLDKTATIMAELEERYPQVRAIGYTPNRGRGHAVRFAAQQVRGNYVLMLDADLPRTLDLRLLRQLYQACQQSDIVLASRYHKESRIRRKPHRALVSRLHRALVRLFFPRFPVRDPDIGCKLFRRDVLRQAATAAQCDGWSWDLQMLVWAWTQGFRIRELPFVWEEDYSQSTVSLIRDVITEFCGLFLVRYQAFVWLRRKTPVSCQLSS